MDQKFEGTPKADVRLEGRKVIRGDVSGDWGLRLQWQVKRDGEVVATPSARAETAYEHPDQTPGKYEIVLQMWKYINFRKNKDGEYTDSHYIEISDPVSYTI